MLPRFAAELLLPAIAGRPVTRDLAGRAAVYLRARTHYGAADPATLSGARADLAHACSATPTCGRSTRCSRALIWIPDGDDAALDAAAREYRRDHRPPEPDDGRTPSDVRGEGRGVRRGRRPARRRRPADGRRAQRPAHRRAGAATPSDDGTAPERRVAGRGARAGDRRRPRATSSSSSSTTSTCRRCSTRSPAAAAPGADAAAAGHRRADRPDARPRRRPAAVRRRDRPRPPLRHTAAPGDHARHAHDRQAHARRALRRPRLRPRPSPAPHRPARQHAPVADHAPDQRADPGAARRARHRHLRLDGSLRVRARPDRLDPHRRPAPDRRALRDRAVRLERRTAHRRHRATAARARHPHRRRHRVRRRRDRRSPPTGSR